MTLLTEQEIYELADDGVFLGNVKEITRAIEAKVIEKIKAQGNCIQYGEAGQSAKYYRLPEGD